LARNDGSIWSDFALIEKVSARKHIKDADANGEVRRDETVSNKTRRSFAQSIIESGRQ
jgi:hypothetical protein